MAILLWVTGCQSAPEAETAVREGPPPLALETFDEVWRIIYEHHFDTNFNGHDWLAVREEYRPKVAAAKTAKEARDTIQEMLDLLDVSHLAIVPSEAAEVLGEEEDEASLEAADEAESGSTGLHVRVADGKAVVTQVDEGSPADEAGVRPGWIVTRVGSSDFEGLTEKLPENFEESRRSFLLWRRMAKLLGGEPGSEVEIEFLDGDDEEVELTLERVLLPGEPVRFGSLPVLYANLISEGIRGPEGADIGLIRFNLWMLPTAIAFNQAIEEHRDADGIIIDLRGNVGGVLGMLIGVSGHFFDESLSLGTLVTRDNRLNLFINPRLVDSKGRRVKPFAGPVAILVDEISASASEVFAGGMKELGRARIFGRQTAGQALPAIYEELPNGDLLYHPFGDFVTGSGVRFEGDGVMPDVKVPLRRDALLEGRDETLEAAVRWIEGEVE